MLALLKFTVAVADAFADAALGCAVHVGALVGEIDTEARRLRDETLGVAR